MLYGPEIILFLNFLLLLTRATFAVDEQESEGGEIIAYTHDKRECSCIAINPARTKLQCNCGHYGQPSRQSYQQQKYQQDQYQYTQQQQSQQQHGPQQQTYQYETPPPQPPQQQYVTKYTLQEGQQGISQYNLPGQCGCVMVNVKMGAPQYECDCGMGQGPEQYDQPSTTSTTTTPAPTTTLPRLPPSPIPDVISYQPPCACVNVNIMNQPAYRCACAQPQPQSTPLYDAPRATTTTQRTTTKPKPRPVANTPKPYQAQNDQPMTTPCLSGVNVDVCVCSPGYVPCDNNLCCHQKFRSMKETVEKENTETAEKFSNLVGAMGEMLKHFSKKLKNQK